MTKRPWHEQAAALAVFPWWVNLALGMHAVVRGAGTALDAATGDRSVSGGDMAWAVVGLVMGTVWLAMAYAKRRHRQPSELP